MGIVGEVVRCVPEHLLLLLSLAAAAINSWVEWHHRIFSIYFLVHLPVGAVGKSIARACLSSLFSKTVPLADMGLAQSVLNVCQSAVSIMAPLYGGMLLGHMGVASQPIIASANYCILLLLSYIVLAKPAAISATDVKIEKRE